MDDDHFPIVVSCTLRDIHGRAWQFVEKAPVVSTANLTAQSSYPQNGDFGCRVISRSVDATGRATALIDTSSPWGIESTDGCARFEVFADQLVEVADVP
ncbi:MAG TPA: hypothetical protein VFY49_13025 [Myxococcota bacterium]|nr:hypothetical protein [Myxococcota bacterium]